MVLLKDIKIFVILFLTLGVTIPFGVQSSEKDDEISRVTTFVKPKPLVKATVLITWVVINDPDELNELCIKMGTKPTPGLKIEGCVIYDLKKKTCTFWLGTPKSYGGIGITNLGHETFHCFVGWFHE